MGLCLLLCCCMVLSGFTMGWGRGPASVILDTDISSDVDDVGAIAVLHTLADRGVVKILAMMLSSGDPWGGACLDALNTSFGRPDIPIGIIKDATVTHVSKYTEYIAKSYPHDLKRLSELPDAVVLYREILSGQPDDSVTVVSIGYLSNLSRLLQSGPDRYSSLDGRALLAKKVNKLVVMGGQFPVGREWNFYQDSKAATRVVRDWPTKVQFCGFEIGERIMTGQILVQMTSDHPLKKAYQLYNSLRNRQSWDQVTLLLALDGSALQKSGLWNMSDPGTVQVDQEGNNSWVASKDGTQSYMIWSPKTGQLAVLVDEMMLESMNKKPSRLRK